MKAITQILSEFVSQAFEIAGYDPSLGVVTASDRLDLCQFQCNGAFPLPSNIIKRLLSLPNRWQKS